MTAHDRITEILYNYEIAGLIECDPVKVLSYLSEDVIGIGLGEQGFVSSKKEISDIMLATIKKDLLATYSLEIKDIAIHLNTENTASLCAKVYVKRLCNGEETLSGFMQSLSFVQRGMDWRICSLHASPIMLSQETIESYPLRFADNTLAKLKADIQQDTFELMNRNFSGGIMGIYAEEPYELYFANDRMIGMLGYGREEFEADFAKNAGKIFQIQELQKSEYIKKIDSGEDFSTRNRWKKKDNSDIWVDVCTRKSEDDKGEAVLISIVTDITEIVTLQMETERQNEMILASIRYGSKIQRTLLPRREILDQAFSDHAIIWNPRDIVGGDIYWVKNFKQGTVCCVSDCTGHGIPGALLTMLVVSAFDNYINESNCSDPAGIMWELNQRLVSVFDRKPWEEERGIRDGCDLAVLFIAKDRSVSISSAHTHVYICDGKEVTQLKGQHLFIGESRMADKEDIKVLKIPANPDNKFYIASDGLSDQPGGPNSCPYGYRGFKKVILENHHEKQSVILDRVWEAFETWRGDEERVDDFELISFKI